MKHPIQRTLLALALCLLLAPAPGLAEGILPDPVKDAISDVVDTVRDAAEDTIDTLKDTAEDAASAVRDAADSLNQSGVIEKPLNPELLSGITLSLENVDATLTIVPQGEEPYARLDATILGVGADEATYSLDVIEMETRLFVEAKHQGDVTGIDRVKVTLYLPEEGLSSLSISVRAGSLTLDGVHVGQLAGSAQESAVTAKAAVLDSVNLTGTDTEFDLHGELYGLVIDATGGAITAHTSVMPQPASLIALEADVTLYLPETDEGFALTYAQTGRGDVESDFTDGALEKQGTLTAGAGENEITAEVTGGSLRVLK